MAVDSSTIQASQERTERLGFLLVLSSALLWSLGGTFARYVGALDSWTIIFWRSAWAAIFLLGFMLWRDGWRATARMFRDMGVPGLIVGLCFALASSCFVVALTYTTVANIVLIGAGVPLMAALIGWVLFREKVSGTTWLAIVAVLCGVVIMVSDSFGGTVSPIGDGLALILSFAFATATVITRRYSHVRMTPATCLGTIIACVVAAFMAPGFATSIPDMGWLFAFGAINLGLGLACFASGARLIPAAFAALVGTLETVLGPIWVWLVHNEIPSLRTILGGSIVFLALLVHIGMQFRKQMRPARPGTSGVQTPY